MRKTRFIMFAVALATMAGPVWGQTNAKQILAMSPAELIVIVERADAPVFDKAKACQRLAVVGGADAVPGIVALLAHESLNVYARTALENIDDPAAAAALREATARLQGRPLLGLINSIGQRRDAQAVTLLEGLLPHGDPAVASAAAGALGRIATPEAAVVLTEALGKDSPAKNQIADASLACGEGLLEGGNEPAAVAMWERVSDADVPKHIKAAAIGARLRARGAAAKDLLVAQLRHEDRTYFNVGLAAARTMPGDEITAALASELETLSPERQSLLLRALGGRREPAPVPLILKACQSPDARVREAAIAVLAASGDAQAVDVLLEAATGAGDVAKTAVEGLKHLAGKKADAAIVARLADADANAPCILLALVGARRIADAKPRVRDLLDDADEGIRIAALGALGALAELKDLDTLIAKTLADGSQSEAAAARSALEAAVVRISDRDACAAKLAATLDSASPTQQAVVLELLGTVGSPQAMQTVLERVASDNPATKDAATRVLGNWPNADAEAALLDIAKNDAEEKYRIRALRGYLRIARQFAMPPKVRLEMFDAAMEAAQRNEEKIIALGILSRIPSTETLQRAASHVDDPALAAGAADVTVKIAGKLVGQNPKAVAEAVQKVVDVKLGGDLEATAKQLLGRAKAAQK